jgi:very-short-patch-repair endonuclease
MAYDYDTSDPSYYGLLKVYASENKKYQTEAEKMLWLHLRGNKLGLHFRRQHIIGCYIADFVCLKKKIIIEVDGGYHSQPAQAIKDYYRTEQLESLGFKVLRFKNEDIFSNVVFVLDQIFNAIARPS